MTLVLTQAARTDGPRVGPVSLTVQPGTLTAVLGPSGAGKSTLLGLCAGDRAPDAGQVELAGQPAHGLTPRHAATHRAVLLQHHDVGFAYSARDVLGFSPLAPRSAAGDAAWPARLLHDVGLADAADRPVHTLSGGEQRRVHLVRVLAQLWTAPDDARGVALLDEPVSGLDMGHAHGALALVRRFCAAGGAVLTALHDPALAAAYADEVLLLKAGRVLGCGAPGAVMTAEALSALYDVPIQATTLWDHAVFAAQPRWQR